jgi:hypothetical protein
MGRKAGINTRLARVGVELVRAELAILPIDPAFRYPVPAQVRLLGKPPRSAEIRRYQALGTSPEWLEWKQPHRGDEQLSPPIRGCLSQFVKLVDAPAEKILEFARTWGMLGICEHHKPYMHRDGCRPLGLRSNASGGNEGWEPVSVWHRYARSAATVLTALENPLPTRPAAEKQAWQARLGRIPERRFPISGDIREIEPQLTLREIALCVHGWQAEAKFKLRTVWSADRARFSTMLELARKRVLYGHLYCVLAMQLGAAVGSPYGAYRCSNPDCGTLYNPDGRTPQEGRNHYCPTCSCDDKVAKSLSYHKNKDRWPSVRRGRM